MLRLILLLVPAILAAAGMAYVSSDPVTGAVIGGIAGFVLGIALNAFPNLNNNNNEEENTDLPLVDE